MDHYRCSACFIPSTSGKMNADIVKKIHKLLPSQVITDQYLRQAAIDLLEILQSPEKYIQLLSYGSILTNAYIQVAQILKRATPQPSPSNHPTPAPMPSLTPTATLMYHPSRLLPHLLLKKHQQRLQLHFPIHTYQRSLLLHIIL